MNNMILKEFIKKIIKRIVRIGLENDDIIYHGSQKPKFQLGVHRYTHRLNIYCWDSKVNISIGKYCSLADNVTIMGGAT